ncbi:MAG: methyltransferase domain-containing protein [Chloracidobacterium sp.]|nr:methyltransferase domain-containing protein [Chloracidobacterium sp.]
MKLSFTEFDSVYQSSVDEIWLHWNEKMQADIAKHCIAWAPGRMDFLGYLQASSVRFYKAYCSLIETGGKTVCDVGGFWGVWPVTAKKLGFDVSMTETLKFYGESFTPLFEHITQSGVKIFDYDPFVPDANLPQKFDLVTVMAVLEHYPHSLKTLVDNLKHITAGKGHIYFEAPNIAYLPKRIRFLFGLTPLVNVSDIYLSEAPFIGHHHEFTLAEMRDLAQLSGLKIIKEDLYNYSPAGKDKFILFYPFISLAFALSKTSRECIAVLCETKK